MGRMENVITECGGWDDRYNGMNRSSNLRQISEGVHESRMSSPLEARRREEKGGCRIEQKLGGETDDNRARRARIRRGGAKHQ